MPYTYSKKQQKFARLLEAVANVVLFPLKFNKSFGSKKILFVEPFQMGDVLSLTTLFAPLLKKNSETEIYVLTKQSSGAILKMDTRIKEIVTVDFPWSDYGKKKNQLTRILQVLARCWQLRKYHFDVGIDTRGDVRSQVLLLLAGCSRRIGYQNYLHSNLWIKGSLLTDRFPKSKYMHRYQWNLELLTLLGFQENDLFPIVFPTFIVGNAPAKTNSIVIHVGGGWEYKRWSEANWLALISRLLAQKTEEIYVIGGPGEKEIIERLQQQTPSHPRAFFKTTSMSELMTLLAQCKQFIGLDSGPMNLAVCLNKPVVALFGPGDSTMWHPISKGSTYIHKKEKFPCNPCAQIECFYAKSNCMQQVLADEVYYSASVWP